MGLTINTNIASLIAQYNLDRNAKNLNVTTERMASGLKINHASDDAAGLSISETLRTQIRGVQKATENSQDGVSLLQIAEGSLSVMIENLQRIREMTVQAANDTNSSVEREAIRLEVATRVDDMKTTKASTNFNKITLLDGSVTSYLLRVGPNSDVATNTLDISGALKNTTADFLSTKSTAGALSIAFTDGTGARSFLADIDAALKDILEQRATLGALQNRIESIIQNLQISKENLTSTESRIRNVDLAQITSEYSKNQILREASINVLSQANSMPTIAIDLLNQSIA